MKFLFGWSLSVKLAGKAAFFSKAKIFGFRFFSVFFVAYTCKMACNLAVVHPTKEYLPPSCSSLDSASDKIVFYAIIKHGR